MKDAINTLRDCEVRLRQNLADAAQAGDYDSVLEITRIITSIVALIPDGGSKHSKTVSPTAAKRKRRQKYPHFHRQRQELVKTGWSKKDKKPYEHRAPKAVVDALVNAILRVGKSGDLMTTDAWFPLHIGDEEIPAYQAYLCLAWLRDIKFVVADGRKGYRLSSKDADKSMIKLHWDKLLER